MPNYSYGSQRELFQYLVDPERRLRINRTLLEDSATLREFARVPAAIDWISHDPRTGKELKDSAWEEIGLRGPSPQAVNWWPRGGPTWDAAARVTSPGGEVGSIFVEAKGRVPEMLGSGCKSTDAMNRRMITNALYDVQNTLDIPRNPTWLGPAYQSANRLAWLWFAREHPEHHADPLPVWLLSVYFCGVVYEGVKPVMGPASEADWRPEIDRVHAEMGLAPAPHALSNYWLELFLPSIVEALDGQ